jgi:hypothetical protein
VTLLRALEQAKRFGMNETAKNVSSTENVLTWMRDIFDVILDIESNNVPGVFQGA